MSEKSSVVVEVEARQVTDGLFGTPVQVVDVPATGREVTTLAERATRSGLPTTWRGVDPREPLTAGMVERIMAEYAAWLPRNIKARGRTASAHTLREYEREARFFVGWLAEQPLPDLPDWFDGPDGVWRLWVELDQVYPRPIIPLVLVTTEIAEGYLETVLAGGHGTQGGGSRNPRAEDGGYTPATIGKKKVSLQKFFTFCRKQRWMATDPLDDAEIVNRLPRDRRSKVQKLKTLFPEEATRLVEECNREIAAASGHPDRQARAIRNYAIVCLMMGQGLRTVEIERLSLASYDPAHGTITVLGKGEKERTIPLRPVPHDVLKLWLKFRELYRPESDAIFINLRAGEGGPAGEVGQRMGRRRIRQIVDQYLERCGLKRPGVSCHALRHTYATGIVWLSRKAGVAVDMAGIALTMGHSDTKTTEVYVDVVDLHENNPARLLDGWFQLPDLG